VLWTNCGPSQSKTLIITGIGKYVPHSYSGRADNLVFLHSKNGIYTRSRPSKYPHTVGTKQAAAIFGKAASIDATLRANILPGLSLESYKGFQKRLTVAIANWIRSNPAGETIHPTNNIQSLLAVEYNEKGKKMDVLWRKRRIVRLAGPGVLEIIIPAFNPIRGLSVAPDTKNVSFSLTAVSVGLDARRIGSAAFEFSFDYSDQQIEERIIPLELPTPAGSLVVTAASLKCWGTSL
jgi:hypothetical protein